MFFFKETTHTHYTKTYHTYFWSGVFKVFDKITFIKLKGYFLFIVSRSKCWKRKFLESFWFQSLVWSGRGQSQSTVQRTTIYLLFFILGTHCLTVWHNNQNFNSPFPSKLILWSPSSYYTCQTKWSVRLFKLRKKVLKTKEITPKIQINIMIKWILSISYI